MSNCLVTKLKSAVDSPLPKLGTLIIHHVAENVDGYNALGIRVVNGQSCTISVDNDASFTLLNGSTTYTSYKLDGSNKINTFMFTKGDFNIYISNKYAIYTLEVSWEYNGAYPFRLDTSEFEFLINLKSTSFKSLKGNIKYFNKAPLETLRMTGVSNKDKEIFGDLSELTNIPLIKTLSLKYTNVEGDISNISKYRNISYFEIQYSNISGDISDIGTLTALKHCNIDGTNITGSVESFVEAQKDNGRTVCDNLYFGGLLKRCSFGGDIIAPNPPYILTWDERKIAVYTGSDTIETCPKVYAKNATTAEIEAWQQAGKTVIKVS